VKWSARTRSAVAPPTPTEGGWIPLRATLMRVATGLDRWLPRAKVGAGTVRWPGGGLSLASATWTGRTLAVENLAFGPLKTRATLAFPVGTDVLRLTARTIDANGTASLESRGANVTGDVTWWEQRAALKAQFGEHGWLPAEATLQADGWRCRAHAEARRTLRDRARPRENRVARRAFRRRSGGERRTGGRKIGAAAGSDVARAWRCADVHRRGVARHLPGITAQLSEPVTIDRQGRFQPGAARFTLQAELAKQPWFAATGTVSGEARLVAGGRGVAGGRFQP
jgi:hypothetical protein